MGLKPWLFSCYLLQKMHRFLSFLDSLNLGLNYANVVKKGISFLLKLMFQGGTIHLRAALDVGCHRDTLQPLKNEWKVLPWQLPFSMRNIIPLCVLKLLNQVASQNLILLQRVSKLFLCTFLLTLTPGQSPQKEAENSSSLVYDNSENWTRHSINSLHLLWNHKSKSESGLECLLPHLYYLYSSFIRFYQSISSSKLY